MTNFNEYSEILEAKEVTIHHLLKHFKKNDLDYDQYGNIFINFKKETKKLPILVAHTDNVLGDGERHPVFSLDGKRLFCANGTGIGFDDKAGIIGIIELWKSIPQAEKMFRIMLPAQEEVGGIGAEHIDIERYNQAAYIIELDRKGDKDIIQESGCTRLCTDKFAKKWEDLGFKRAIGTFTDLNKFKPKTKNIEMCNLSIGYYNPHTKQEYLETKEFENIISKVKIFIMQNKDETFVDDEPDIYEQDYNRYPLSTQKYNEIKRDGMVGECDCCGRRGIIEWNEDAGMYLCEECSDWYNYETGGEKQC